MKLVPTPLPGAYVVELEPIRDERGWFARTFDAAAFADLGLDAAVVQCNTSFNERAGTLARAALPDRAARGAQARPLHAGRACTT